MGFVTIFNMKTSFSSPSAALLFLGLLFLPQSAFSWGQKGHDVVCAVAEQHLSNKARKHIDHILDGKSIVYWANWMDNASHKSEYAYTKTWHFKNVDASESFEDAPINEKGDVLLAVQEQIEKLENGFLSKEEQALSLKMLVHFMGDLHCPLHIGHKSDLGGNKWQVQYFGRGSNLHSVWDSGVVESAHNWTYSEWVEQIDRVNARQCAAIVAGTPADWALETYEVCRAVYDGTPVGSKLSYDYVAEWAPVVEDQLLKGGLRLAKVLNDIF